MSIRFKSIIPYWLLTLSVCLSSCAYRFTNIAMTPPDGIRTIAVESIYDTSRNVIPHEILWTEIMEEFAKNGRLIVTSKEEADALVIVELTNAQIQPSGAPSSESIYRDPTVTDTYKGTPFQFKNLKRAGNWTTEELLSFKISVVIHNLHTKQKIFQKNYSTSGNFRSIRASTVVQKRSVYLLYEEALEARMKSLSQGIASRVVTDFLL